MSQPGSIEEHKQEVRPTMLLQGYADQPFLDRNYGKIRGHFESPMRKILRHEGIAFVGEFIGTFFFFFMSFMVGQGVSTTRYDSKTDSAVGDEAGFLVLATGWGLALLVNAAVWYRVTGAQFNPAVSLGLAVTGAIKPLRFAVVVVAQILAGIVSSAVAKALSHGGLRVMTALSTSGAYKVTKAQGFFVEVIATAQLVIVVLFLAVEKHRATPMAPLFIGFALFLIVLLAARFTGAGVNPARSLGPAIVANSYPDIWIYIVAPFCGSLLAAGIFALIKFAGYQDVSAGQDAIAVEEVEYALPKDVQSDAERDSGSK